MKNKMENTLKSQLHSLYSTYSAIHVQFKRIEEEAIKLEAERKTVSEILHTTREQEKDVINNSIKTEEPPAAEKQAAGPVVAEPTAAAGASLVSSSLPSRQVLPLLSPCATASPLVESLVEPQVGALFQVQHNGQRRRQRAAAARRYTLLLQAFRPGHSLPPPKSNAIPALYCAGAGVPRNKRLLEAGCGCGRHYPLHATAGQRLT